MFSAYKLLIAASGLYAKISTTGENIGDWRRDGEKTRINTGESEKCS